MSGPGPINLQGIEVYERRYGLRFTEWEVDVLEMFDRIAMEAASKSQS